MATRWRPSSSRRPTAMGACRHSASALALMILRTLPITSSTRRTSGEEGQHERYDGQVSVGGANLLQNAAHIFHFSWASSPNVFPCELADQLCRLALFSIQRS